MEIKVTMTPMWGLEDKLDYTIREDNSDPEGYIIITPNPNKREICLGKRGIEDLIDVLMMLKNRM